MAELLPPGTVVQIIHPYSAFRGRTGIIVDRQTTCPCCEVYGVQVMVKSWAAAQASPLVLSFARQELAPRDDTDQIPAEEPPDDYQGENNAPLIPEDY